ncbi:hypothetical protein G9A89_021663 [Geosiphon pyriformis]|nr:hypothetical protein G9A89_021663 [Geosiphon pyriformis]
MSSTNGIVAKLDKFIQKLEFYLNGTFVQIENPDPDLTLLQYVRSIGLTGTKLGCAEGGCGSCTVLVSSYDSRTKKIIHRSVNGCLAPLCSLDGKHVITIEGIGNSRSPHPVQQRIALLNGSQCGFCTPGIVMSLYALLRNNPNPSEKEIEECFDGNLCRCTGYRPILDAAKTFAESSVNCCRSENKEISISQNGLRCQDSKLLGCGRVDCCQKNEDNDNFVIFDKFPKLTLRRYDPTQELIFPPSLINRKPMPLYFVGRKTKWFSPIDLHQLLQLKRDYPTAKLVSGNTEVGIETKFKKMKYTTQIYLGDVKELQICEFRENGLTIGGNVTLSSFQDILIEACKNYKPYKSQVFHALLSNLRWFAGNQIRNVASPAGNIITGSPISDLNPVFLATKTLFTLTSLSPENETIKREIPSKSFWTGYRQTILAPTEILEQIFIPCSTQGEFVRAYKQAKRRDDDIAIVNASCRVLLDENNLIKESSFAFGGMSGMTLRAARTEEEILGLKWGDEKVLKTVLSNIYEELELTYSAPGGMASYRRSLAAGFIYKFWHDVGKQIGVFVNDDDHVIDDLIGVIERDISKSLQILGNPEDGKSVIGQSLPHVSALKHVTGEAIYVDDIPKMHGELYGALLLSQQAHARIISIDPSEALSASGVHGFFSAKDVPGDNKFGTLIKDETVFANEEVSCVGQIIGLIVAESQVLAQEAVMLVKVKYEPLPHIITIEEAIEMNSFFPFEKELKRGNVENALNTADFDRRSRTFLSRDASQTQMTVASVLGISSNKVICRVKRLGGGFGGKETKNLALTTALAVGAWHLKKPIRCMLDRDEDIVITGQRHPFLAHWRMGINKDGKIQGIDAQVYSNGGYSIDLSGGVLVRCINHMDGCYYMPNYRIKGKICKTNTHSNTAFRGFGAPQGMMITENMLCEVAESLNMSVDELRIINFYQEGQKTPFNQTLTDWHLPQIYKQLKETSDFEKRRLEVDVFNQKHKWRKRGLAFIPTKFGLSFDVLHLNQAGALVHIYLDGSVLVSHGGVEMGQGLHTKMLQIAAETLGISMEHIHLIETSTSIVANSGPTAASVSSDLNGYAVANACQQLMERLKPYREKMLGASFKEICQAAHFDRVNLSANGFYKAPDIGYDPKKNEGQLYLYFTTGAAVSEVEVDILTGDHTILRSDLCMDIGRSLNYAIDLGQIEGAFIQGVGWCTLEESLFFPNGHIFTRGPGNYKIPGFRDIPQDFRVSTLQGVQYPTLKTIHSSKGVGEPPLFLGASVFYAIRDAIKSARADNGIEEVLTIKSPATSERIRMACLDDISNSALVSPKDGERSWVTLA